MRPQDQPLHQLKPPPQCRRLPLSPHRLPEAAARGEGFRLIAGVDEAGRGPWAGPVVAAAVVLRRTRFAVRIDDSKRLSPLQRERACELILQQAHVGVGLACAEEIDQHNILQAALLAMARAVNDLPIAPELILVDGPATPRLTIPCWPVIHGDAVSRVIACASIVAKVTRDRLMCFYHRLVPQYAFDEHKGYGTPQHRLALTAWGPSPLHRLSFHPVALATGPADFENLYPPAEVGLTLRPDASPRPSVAGLARRSGLARPSLRSGHRARSAIATPASGQSSPLAGHQDS